MLRGRGQQCRALDGLLADVRAGRSQVLVMRGEPGIGKTALLGYAADMAQDFQVARAEGVESEMELPYAALQQLCGRMLDGLAALPGPQRDALRVAFGLSSGSAPDRFLIGLAVLGLLSEVAAGRPLLCLVDDAQWLDQASARVLAFVGRRLDAESVALLFGTRDAAGAGDLVGLPALAVEGLADADARVLLASVLPGRLDERVRDRIIAESGGNPLALLELPRGVTAAELVGGFGLPGTEPLSGRIEDSFRRRIAPLPATTRRLLLLAAAEPTGDPALLWRAAGRLGISDAAAAAAETDGLLTVGARSSSATRWLARRYTGQPRRRTGGRCMVHWPRRPIRGSIPTIGPGTARRPHPHPTKTSPPSLSGRLGERRRAAGSLPRRPSSTGLPR